MQEKLYPSNQMIKKKKKMYPRNNTSIEIHQKKMSEKEC